MPRSEKTYDPRCWDLAELFMEDTPMQGNKDYVHELAIHIQQSIEDWLLHQEETSWTDPTS